MEVSSSTAPTVNLPEGKDPMQKATEVQGQQVMKILEGMEEQTRAMTAHKTGVGNSVNLSA